MEPVTGHASRVRHPLHRIEDGCPHCSTTVLLVALFPVPMVAYPLAVIADVAMDVCSSRARLRFASSTRIVVMCRVIEKGTR